MKLLHLIPTLDPKAGGPVEGVRQLAGSLAPEGHTIEVACLDEPGAPWLAEFPLATYPLGPRLGKYGYSSRYVPWVKKHSRDYHCIIVNGIWQFHSYGAWLALRGSDVPYVLYTHGMLDPWFRDAYPMKHAKKVLYWQLAEHRVLRDARAVIFTCDEERVLAGCSFRPYLCNPVTVNYGTAGPTGDPDAQRAAFRKAFPELSCKRVVLFLGRVHPKKGCDLLIEAFAGFADAYPDLHLVIAGPYEAGAQAGLRKQAAALGVDDRVTWTGMLTGDLKWGAFHEADVFALPSHQENFGIAVAEALACGLPVLISSKVNIWREIAAAGSGFVGRDTLAGTSETLRRWLESEPTKRDAMRGRARACFLNQFQIRRAARNLLQTIHTHALNGSRPACDE